MLIVRLRLVSNVVNEVVCMLKICRIVRISRIVSSMLMMEVR